MTRGIILFAHGSRVESANEAVREMAAKLALAGGFDHVQAAFLELGQPDLEGAVVRLEADGVRSVVVVPYFVTLGLHLERDLPRLVDDISCNHNHLDISVTRPLDGHPALIGVLLDRVKST